MEMQKTGTRHSYGEAKRFRRLYFDKGKSADLILNACGTERCPAGKRFEFELRRGYRLYVVQSGKGTIWNNEKQLEVRKGHILLIRPEDRVSCCGNDKDLLTYCWVEFEGNRAVEFIGNAGFTGEKGIFYLKQEVEEYQELVLAMQEHRSGMPVDELCRLSLLLKYISLVIEAYERKHKVAREYRDYDVDGYIQLALDYIEQNLASVTVSELAEYVGIHRSYLTSLFKQQMGTSPQNFILSLRMEEGCRLLKDSTMPIQEIAAAVGYENPLTFSKIFRNVNGVSPRSYRNMGGMEE